MSVGSLSTDGIGSPQKTIWVQRLPDVVSQFLLGVYLIASQWNPCDSTSVSIGSSLFLILLGIALGLFTALARILDPQEHRVSLNWKLIVTAFFVWLAFSTVQVDGRGNYRSAILGFWQAVGFLGFVSCFYHQATKPGHLESMLRWVVGTVAGTVAYALYQYLFSFPRMRAGFLADPARFFENRGIAMGSAEAMQWENRILSTEPLGPFALTNSLAGFVGPWFVIILAAILWMFFPETGDGSKKSMSSRDWMRRFPSYFLSMWVLAIGSATVLILTKSRTAWMAVIITSIVLLIGKESIGSRSFNSLRRYQSAFAPLLLGIGLVGFFVLWRDPLLLTEASKSFTYRLQYWHGAFALLESSPWFGVGPLNFQQNYSFVKSIVASETPADPHNLWAEISMWGGIPALLMAIGMAGGLLQMFAFSLAKEAYDKSELPPPTPYTAKSLLVGDFGASFGLVGVIAFAILGNELDALLCAVLFAVVAFYISFSLVAPSWGRFVLRNQAKIGLILCTFMCIHLSFSGGWMQPGCMNALLIGSALAFVSSKVKPRKTDDLHEWSPWIPMLTWGSLAAAFALTTYVPESRLSSWETDRLFGRWEQSSAAEWRDMMKLHKNAPDLAASAASHAFQRATDPNLGEKSRDDWLALYDDAAIEWGRRDPENWSPWYQTGVQRLQLSEAIPTSSNATMLERADSDLALAASRNPTSIQAQLQAAIGAVAVNKMEQAKGYLDQVAKIEESTPHLDKKLAVISAYVPYNLRTQLRLNSDEFLESQPVRPSGSTRRDGFQAWRGQVLAEPLYQQLRTFLR